MGLTEGGRSPTGVRPKPAIRRWAISKVAKFSEEQKYEIALELLSGKLSHGEICRKYGISSTYAYKLKDRALEILREGMGRPVGRTDPESERLQKRIVDLEQLAGDQALVIRTLKKMPRSA
jgi:transposase-like protein